MKNFLLLFAGFLVIVVLFADGGLNVSPNISPSPSFSFASSINYAPDRSVTTTHIDTNIEHQTVIVGEQRQPSSGVTTVDPVFRACQPLPGEVVESGSMDTKGACTVLDQSGQRWFINANGTRWPIQDLRPLSNSDQSSNQQNTMLQPAGQLTIEQMQVAFLRNGGQLPFNWSWFGEERKRRYLTDRLETWK